MITVGISKWPTESGQEVGKRSLKMKQPPDFVQVIGPYMYPDENEGISSITIFKYEKSRHISIGLLQRTALSLLLEKPVRARNCWRVQFIN